MKRLAFAGLFSAAFIAGCGGPSAAERREIAEWVIAQGGTVVTDEVLEVKTVGNLPQDAFQIERIELKETDIADADLQKIKDLRNLEYLGLYGTAVTDAGLNHVIGLHSLRELELSYTQVTDDGLQTLAKLPDLEKLFVTGTSVTPKGIVQFKEQRSGCEVFRLE